MSSFAPTLVATQMKNILFATDFSPCSVAALPYAVALAERYGATIHLIHGLAPEPIPEVRLYHSMELEAVRMSADLAMETLVATNSFGKIASTATVRQGPLLDVLEAFVEEKNIDLIVLGTHGRRGLKKLVLGSVAESVFRLAPCPVLTVGPEAMHEGAADASFKTILFATDFYSASRRALAYAVSMAQANHSHLILLHAMSDSMEVPDLARAGQRMADLISAETMHELEPEIVAEAGPAAETILRVARNKEADLIVMGAHHAEVAAHLPWTIASTVVCKAHCPTLTVRG